MSSRNLQLIVALTVISFWVMKSPAQQLDDPSKPYDLDEHTVVLLHLDNDYQNASNKTDAVIPHGNLMLMKATDLDFPARFGNALYLDNDAASDSSYLEIPDTDALDLDSSWTLEGWINLLSIGVAWGDWNLNPKLFVKGAGDNCNFWVGPMNGGRYFQVGYQRINGGWDDCNTQPNTFQLNTWYHVAAIRDGANAILALAVHDTAGNLMAWNAFGITPGHDGKPRTNDAHLTIGFCDAPWPDGAVNGFIDEIRISDVIRHFPMPPIPKGILQDPVMHLNANQDVEIEAEVVNWYGDITSVKLMYSTGGDFMPIEMQHKEGNIYTATIPGQPAGTEVRYYIWAENTSGYSATSRSTIMRNFDGLYGITYDFENQTVLNLDFEQTLYDSSDLHYVVTDTFGTVQYSNEAVSGNYSVEFTGAGTYMLKVDKPAAYLAPSDITIDFWIKPDTVRDNYVILSKWHDYTFERNDWRFNYRLWWNWSTNLWFEFFTTADDSWHHLELPQTMEAHQWYHVIVKYSSANSQGVMEVRDSNDVIIAETSDSFSGKLRSRAGEFIIGGDRYDFMWPFRFDGKIDKLKIMNYAVNMPPVARRFDEPPIRHLKSGEDYTVSCDVENATSAVVHYSMDGVNFAEAPMTKSVDMTFSIKVDGQPKGTVVSYYIEASNDEGKTVRLPANGYNYLAYADEKDMTLKLDFEEGSGVPMDKSDYGNVVTVIGNPQYVTDAAEGNYAIELNDTSFLQIDAPAPFEVSPQIHVELRFKPLGSTPADGADLIAKYSDPPEDWRFGYRTSFWDGGKRLRAEVHLYANDPSQANWEWRDVIPWGDPDNPELQADQWYHYVFDVGNDSAYVFLYDANENLLLKKSMDISGQHVKPARGFFRIGKAWPDGMPVFKGLIDDVRIYNYSVVETGTGIEKEPKNSLPRHFALEQNFPNPFNPSTEIRFALPQNARVQIIVYNILGQKVRTLISKNMTVGWHSVKWDGSNDAGQLMPSGVYFYKMETRSFVKVRKMLYLR